MSGWDALVTTALLGTERRALPDGLPAAVGRLAEAQPDRGLAVLDAAAGYAGYRHAGAVPGGCAEPAVAPRQRLGFAPEPAQRLLGRLLAAREPVLVDTWVRRCADLGLGVRPRHWTALTVAAAGPRGPDRARVRSVLGERGRAFVATNPRWRAVLRETAPAPEPADSGWTPEDTERALSLVEVTGTLRRKVRVSLDARQIAAAVPRAELDAWQPHTGLAPRDLVGLLRRERPERLDDLVAALADATVRQRHVDWAAALVGAGYARADLIPLLPQESHAATARDWLVHRQADEAAVLLATLPEPWDDAVAALALRLMTSGAVTRSTSRRVLPRMALLLPLSAIGTVAAGAEAERDGEAPVGFGEAERLIALRIDIETSFRPPEETP